MTYNNINNTNNSNNNTSSNSSINSSINIILSLSSCAPKLLASLKLQHFAAFSCRAHRQCVAMACGDDGPKARASVVMKDMSHMKNLTTKNSKWKLVAIFAAIFATGYFLGWLFADEPAEL